MPEQKIERWANERINEAKNDLSNDQTNEHKQINK